MRGVEEGAFQIDWSGWGTANGSIPPVHIEIFLEAVQCSPNPRAHKRLENVKLN